MRACEEKSLEQDIRGDVERFAGRMESEVSSIQSKLEGIEQMLGRLVENRSPQPQPSAANLKRYSELEPD